MHSVIQSAFLSALGLALAGSLWQMAILWLLYQMLTGMGRRLSAPMRHSLASLLVIGGTAWFFVSLIWNLASGRAASFHPRLIGLDWTNSNHGLPFWDNLKNTFRSSLPYLSSIYLVVLFYQVLRYAFFFRHSQELKNSGLRKIRPELRVFVARISARLGIRQKVAVWLSDIVETPMTLGFLKPVILIPIATINHLTTQQVEAVLLHELAHIRRKDYLLNLLVSVSGIFFFFNPFSRLLIHEIKKHREHSCDDLVMQFGYESAVYASALLSLERTRHEHHRLVMAAIGRSNQLLLERIKRLTGQHDNGVSLQARLLGSLLITLFVALCTCYKPEPVSGKSLSIARIAASRESLPLQYILTSSPTHRKGTDPIRKHVARKIESSPQTEDIQLTLANADGNPEPGSPEAQPILNVLTDSRESSMAVPAPESDNQGISMTAVAPYVPSSSFSYQITDDSTMDPVYNLNYNEKAAVFTVINAITASGNADLNKLEREITVQSRKFNRKQSQIQSKIPGKRNLTLVLGNSSRLTLSQTEEFRSRENLQILVKALKDQIAKDGLQGQSQTHQRLRNQILNEKLRLQQDYLNKQQQFIKKLEQPTAKRKQVYI
jgi:Zn-dependent protease with chaperone function